MGGRATALANLRRLVSPPREETFVLEERYRALQRQIPLLYVIVLANLLGLQIVNGGVFRSLYHPVNGLILLVAFRLVHWATNGRKALPPDKLRRELQKTWILAAGISGLFGLWAILLLDESGLQQQNSVVLFGSLAAVGCAYGLSSFPAAARLPLLLAALPLSIRLTLSADPAHIAMGISLGLVTLLILRLLNVQNAGITELVRSRAATERARTRAQSAEAAANRERERAEVTANTDALTGLLNRRAFLAALGDRNCGQRAVALVDLDGFKPINDTFGHAAGDEVLIAIGQRLQAAAGDHALVARMGGDEFALLLPSLAPEAAIAFGESICWALHRPLKINSREFQLSASCGITIVEPGFGNASIALRQADTALYRSKHNGRGGTAVYSAEMDAAAKRRLAIEASLRDDVVQESITLVYQPIVDLADGRIRCFEALARWKDPDLGQVSPCEFIPIAEQTNTIEAISSKLLRKAAREARAWPEAIRLSFNLSAAELCGCGAAARILKILAEEGLPPSRLQIEVTETTMLTDFGSAGRELDELRAAGARVVLDDFGAGYASVSYLREMRFDGIKLDGELLKSACEVPAKLKLLKGVLDLCKALELPCVAEQLETPEQLAMLQQNGCDGGQGYYLSHPLTAEETRRLAASFGSKADAGSQALTRLRLRAA